MTGPDHYSRAEVLLEEWEHNRYANRDLDVLERRSGL